MRRTVAIVAACSSCAPCEKLIRATLSPASMSDRRTSGDEEAGPRVQTIFVRERTGAGAPPEVCWVTVFGVRWVEAEMYAPARARASDDGASVAGPLRGADDTRLLAPAHPLNIHAVGTSDGVGRAGPPVHPTSFRGSV